MTTGGNNSRTRRYDEWVGEHLTDDKGLSYEEWDDLFAPPNQIEGEKA